MRVAVSTRGLGRGSGPGVSPDTVRRRAEAMLQALGAVDAELSVLLCDDETIAELNRKYRGRDRATDVLSFPTGDDHVARPGPRLLGDVVVSLPTAARQAPPGPSGLREEVTRLLAHGLLHLLGSTHESRADLRAMERETERLVVLAGATRRPRSAG
jgi:probable rRNA maturation factor